MEFIMYLDLIKGKTVKSATFVNGDESIAILFTDDTCVYIDVEFHGDSYDLILNNDISIYLKRDADIITAEEYVAIRIAEDRASAERVKERELLELEKLTKKYEGGDLYV